MAFRIAVILVLLCFEKKSYCAEIASRVNGNLDSPRVYDTIVVGLGISGLTALSKLARHGQSVLGLEAAERLGGRVHTLKVGDGLVEVGAEWIHGRNNSRTYELAVANNVQVIEQDYNIITTRSDGTEVDPNIVNSMFEHCFGSEELNRTADPQPQGVILANCCKEYLAKHKPEWLQDKEFLTNLLTNVNLVLMTVDGSDDWNDVSSASLYHELDKYQASSWHKYGYKTLIEIILNKHKNGPGLPKNAHMFLNKEVVQIIWNEDPKANVFVKTKDGSSYEAKNVIVTLSLGVLKEKHNSLFNPALPQTKVDAIKNISMGVVNKIILFYDQIWWAKNTSTFAFVWKDEDRAKVPVRDEWTTLIGYASQSMGSDNALVLWTAGKAARNIETLSDEEVKQKSTELLRKFMGKDAPEPSCMIRSNWYSNPFTRGSYSFDNLKTPELPGIRETLGAPILDSSKQPKLLFAGEATNVIHFSTVHGAFETGLREANRLLRDGSNSLDPQKH